MSKIIDPVFGEMEFKYGWNKHMQLNFLEKTSTIRITASSYNQKKITEFQQANYQYFTENISEISVKCKNAIARYVQNNKHEIKPFVDSKTDIISYIQPTAIIFNTDNTFLVLCECPWDPEHGLAIQLPDYKVGAQNLFL